MDLLYGLANGVLFRGGSGTVEAGIVLLTDVFSVTVLSYAWRRQFALLVGNA
ncbi:MAG: hypothetical protein QM638_17910 [Nocardioides sp.]|uniref:hypothetical protein n=1 Tax=Nocardioides sp. TaxID=35761 RepID=UPI0039E4EC57